MASRIIHAALGTLLSERYPIKDFSRFLLGELLPDAYAEGQGTAASHLKCSLCDGAKKTYDLEQFRRLFAEKLKKDDLYRGYYLHLVQDLYFRDFVYNRYHWDPRPAGNVEKLHRDYRLANAYVIGKYQLKPVLQIPEDFQQEALCQLYPYGVEQLKKDFAVDFEPCEEEEAFFFTKEMADDFIQIAVEQSLLELYALEQGSYHTDMVQMAWKNK